MPNRSEKKKLEPPPSRPAYFWWGLANLLALCAVVLSWTACLWIFNNPQDPQNYKILTKLKRAPVLTEFTALQAPSGDAKDPKELYQKFFGLEDKQLAALNTNLMRNYLLNFKNSIINTYATGTYRVIGSRALSKDDLFYPGVVVRAQAMIAPDETRAAMPYPVVIDYLFPTDDPSAPALFKAGDELILKKIPNCASVLHAAKFEGTDEPFLCLTIVPIAYGVYDVGPNDSFKIAPPTSFNLTGPLPPLGDPTKQAINRHEPPQPPAEKDKAPAKVLVKGKTPEPEKPKKK